MKRKKKMNLTQKIQTYATSGARSEIDGLIIKQMVSALIDAVTNDGNIIVITSGSSSSGHNPGSSHYVGLAIDYYVTDPYGNLLPSPQQEGYAADCGFWTLDEFLYPSAASTGGHIHAEYRGNESVVASASESASVSNKIPNITTKELLLAGTAILVMLFLRGLR
jgi:hypothetical protein